MGTFTVKRENHRCMDDCRQEGCPRHTLELTYQTCADVVLLTKDGEVVVGLDFGEFETFLQMCCEIGPLYESMRDFVDAARKDYEDDDDDEEAYTCLSAEEERKIISDVTIKPVCMQYTPEEIAELKKKYGSDEE